MQADTRTARTRAPPLCQTASRFALCPPWPCLRCTFSTPRYSCFAAQHTHSGPAVCPPLPELFRLLLLLLVQRGRHPGLPPDRPLLGAPLADDVVCLGVVPQQVGLQGRQVWAERQAAQGVGWGRGGDGRDRQPGTAG